MTEQQHPITPPPELVEHWYQDGPEDERGLVEYAATQGARWGADQELEACCAWTAIVGGAEALRNHRRPKPPSLKEQSLALIDKIQGKKEAWDIRDLNLVRRALEQLND